MIPKKAEYSDRNQVMSPTKNLGRLKDLDSDSDYLYELLVTLNSLEFGGDYMFDRSGQLKTEGYRHISRNVCFN